MLVAEDFFDEELGAAVGIGGLQALVFGDWQLFGIPVDGGGGREYKVFASRVRKE